MPRLLCIFFGVLISTTTSAGSVELGQPLPALEISELGEIVLEEEEFSYRSWRLPTEFDRVFVLQYLAATRAASKLNEPFTDRLQQEFTPGSYHVTTMINLDDATWGTSGFVVSEVKQNKRRYPDSTMVLDEDAMGIKTWQIPTDTSVIIIIDSRGIVRYVKKGAMSSQEIDASVELIRQQMNSSTS